MMTTIRKTWEESKVCQQMDLGLLQEVLPPVMIEELLETYQMWEERERKLNMVVLTYWLIALHLYPQLSQRAVYAKLVSGQRAWRDDVPRQIPVSRRLAIVGSNWVVSCWWSSLQSRPDPKPHSTPRERSGVDCACWPSMEPSSRCPIRQAIARPSATALMIPNPVNHYIFTQS
jgi:Insertion element 4 transposase N-terminal